MRLPVIWIRRPRLTILQWIVSVAVASPPLTMGRWLGKDDDPSFSDLFGLALGMLCFSMVFLLIFWGVVVHWIDPDGRLLGRPRWSHAELLLDPEGISWVEEAALDEQPAADAIHWIELPSDDRSRCVLKIDRSEFLD